MANDIIIYILLILNIISLILGFIMGKLLTNSGVLYNIKDTESFIKKQSKINNISIDDKKVVTNIKTEGLEKKYSDLGEIKQSQENISSSVNKLKNMKG